MDQAKQLVTEQRAFFIQVKLKISSIGLMRFNSLEKESKSISNGFKMHFGLI